MGPEEELEMFGVGRCYRPLAEPNHPFITKVTWELLGVESAIVSPADLKAQEDEVTTSNPLKYPV